MGKKTFTYVLFPMGNMTEIVGKIHIITLKHIFQTVTTGETEVSIELKTQVVV